MLLPGCRGRQDFLNENDRLRAEVMSLRDQIQWLEQRNCELEQAVSQRTHSRDLIHEDVLANTPRVAAISLGRLSHLRDTDDDGRPDLLVAYVRSVDGLGRFVQVVGELTVHAAVLSADADAVTLLRETLGPAQVRDAYRYSVAGIHYAVERPFELPTSVDGSTLPEREIIVRVVFVDGYTGRSFSSERAVSWRP